MASGHIEAMASAVAEGGRQAGAQVDIKRVRELVPEDSVSLGALVPSTDCSDFRLHQYPRFLADRSTPIAVEIGAPQAFAKALYVDRVDHHATVAKCLFQVRIGGAYKGALLGDVGLGVADNNLLNLGR